MQAASKVALVTGAAQGIGKKLCEGLLKAGTRVCVTDKNIETVSSTTEELKEKYGDKNVMFHKVDVRKLDEFEAAIVKVKGKFGQLDIIGNNAGEVDEDRCTRIIDVNMRGAINGSKLGLKHMHVDPIQHPPSGDGHEEHHPPGPGGVVINISSVLGLAPIAMAPYYTATKFGIVGLTRAMAMTHHDSGVRFNCMCPWFTKSDLLRTPEDMMDDYVKLLLDKFGLVESSLVTDCFVDLANDESKNGHVCVVTKHNGIMPAPMPTIEDIFGLHHENELSYGSIKN